MSDIVERYTADRDGNMERDDRDMSIKAVRDDSWVLATEYEAVRSLAEQQAATIAELRAEIERLKDIGAWTGLTEQVRAQSDVIAELRAAHHCPWVGNAVTYPCGCRSAGPNHEPPWYCREHNMPALAKLGEKS